jgi:putative iron-regulated protein
MLLRIASAAALFTFTIVACSSDDSTPGSTPATPTTALETYAANLYAAYGDALADEQTFSGKVEAFLSSPTEATLATAREGWVASREHYMLTEGARFYDGPIDIDPPNHEAALNSWPLDEAYVDYTTNKESSEVDETAGLINHPDLLPEITVDALDSLNAQGGDENISNGYHSIEFLLWGQALADVGPGARPATDYVVGGPRKNADRRAKYLRAAISSVTQHLTAVHDAWKPDAAYRTTFVKNGNASVALVLTGLGKLSKGELAGERINAAYASKARRDQHNCFSSTTLTDYERDAVGIQGMYLGKYGSNDGPGFDELVRAVNPEVDSRLQKQLQESIDAIKAIPKPFESAIVGEDSAPGRVAIRAAMESLRKQGDLFAEAAAALGLTIVVPEEN